MEGKHEFGQWFVHKYEDDDYVVLRRANSELPGYVTLAESIQTRDDAMVIAAAYDLLTACKLAVQALNTAPMFRVGDTDSYKIASVVDAAIAKAKGEA